MCLRLIALLFAAFARAGEPPCCRPALASGPYTDRSLYQLESKWTSDVGKEVRLGLLRGRVQVVAMFFTHCDYACPILVEDMRRIERALPDTLRDRVDFLLVSFDSERDAPDVLRAFREKRKLSPEHWTLLTGRHDDIRELAALLGVNYQRDTRGQFAHSNVIHVLNPEGEIAGLQTALNQDGQAILGVIERLLAAPQPKP
jgi:protein SCO1/2